MLVIEKLNAIQMASALRTLSGKLKGQGHKLDATRCYKAAEMIDRTVVVAGMYRLALTAIGKDEALPCRCGSDPYTDGEECPKCTALSALETPIEAK